MKTEVYTVLKYETMGLLSLKDWITIICIDTSSLLMIVLESKIRDLQKKHLSHTSVQQKAKIIDIFTNKTAR
jgi:hypothetical protein